MYQRSPRRRPASWLLVAAVLAMMFAGVATASAAGVRLINHDARGHALYVRHASSAVNTSIGPRTVSNICSGPCTIRVKTTGSTINARAGAVLHIRNGRLVQR